MSTGQNSDRAHSENLKVFVAFSYELDKDKDQVVSTLHSMDKYHKHLHIEPVTWKTDIESGSYDKERIQDEINPLLKDCRVVFVLFHSRVGKFTLEEYKLAIKEKKKVFIYFRKVFIEINNEVIAGLNQIADLKKYLADENKTISIDYDTLPELADRVQTDMNLFILRHNDPASPEKVTALEEYLKKVQKANVNQMVSTSEVLFDKTLGDLDENQLINLLEQERVVEAFMGKEVGGITEKLNHLQLLRDNDIIKGTYLCLGKKLRAVSRSAYESRFFLFATRNKTKIVLSEMVTGSLIEQFEKMVQHLKRNLYLVRDAFDRGHEDYEIPQFVFWELLANAFIHREYADKKEFVTTIQVELYPDRLEIKNPGILPAEINRAKLGKKQMSYLRNPEIAEIFFLHKIVERAGSGLLRIQEKLKEKGFRSAKLENLKTGNIVKVTVFKKKRFEEESRETVVEGKLLTPLPYRNTHLVGRDRELAELDRLLGGSTPVVLVNGLGGIGKTELCKQYFLDHYRDYTFAAWVDYVSSVRESLVTALSDAGTRKILKADRKGSTLDEEFERVVRGLRDLGADVLLVMDNIENPNDKDLELLFSLPGTVLVSSRLKLEGFTGMELGLLDEESCLELFYRFYKGKRDDEEVLRLIRICGCHTLTVELLARTAWNAGLTARALLELLVEKGFDLRGVVEEGVRTSWHNVKTRKTFYDHLETLFDISRLSADEEYAAMNLAVLPSQFIRRRSVKDWLGLDSLDVINDLVSKGWLQEGEDGVLMHQVVREVVRGKTKPNAKTCSQLIGKLTEALNLDPDDNPYKKQNWVVFADELVQHITTGDENLAALANNLSTIHQLLGQTVKALEYQLMAFVLYDKVLENNHPLLATSYNNLSIIYQDLGQMEKALEFQLKAIKITEQILDKNHPSLATSYNNLSSVYQELGQTEKALEFQLRDVKISEQILDKNHPSLATSYNNLSLIYKALGQTERSLELQLKAQGIREAVLEQNHPDLAQSYNNLSLVYIDLGQMEKALEFQLKATAIKEQILDKKHPSIAISYNNISLIYSDLGQMEKALEFQKKALEIKEAVLDKNHPDLATSYNNLSTIYYELDNPAPAAEYGRKAVAILRRLFPNGHPNLTIMEENLAIIEKNAKEKRKANKKK